MFWAGGGGGGGVGITPLYGLSEVWATPKGMALLGCLCVKKYTHWTDKGCVFHPGLALGIEHILTAYMSVYLSPSTQHSAY